MKRAVDIMSNALTLFIVIAMVTVTANSASAKTKEIECLAKNIYYEARNQPKIGMIAVANVTMNRVQDERYPSSVCKVVYQKKQFSWTHTVKNQTPKNKIVYEKIYTLAQKVYNGTIGDITSGATHYHATYVKPKWAKRMTKITKIEDHIFYRD